VDLTAADALALRMSSLLLRPRPAGDDRPPPADVAGVVRWFGAMQAQDLASGLWSLGVRLPGHTRADVCAELEKRAVVRTWPMRGTVHWTPTEDAHWMLGLMGARALAGSTARREALGLDPAAAARAVDVLGAALAGDGRMTRSRCLATLTDAGVDCSGQRGYHLLWYASQQGVTAIAPNIGTEQTFVLLDDWAPEPRRLDRDEALATVARRFFRSHGPATRADLVRWTGLTMSDVRTGISAAGGDLLPVRVDGTEMYAERTLLEAYRPVRVPRYLLVLPGFDEYLLGYKDRTLMLDDAHKQAIVPGGNGVFQSTLVNGGRVAGVWKRRTTSKRTVIDVTELSPLSAADRTRATRAFRGYGRFLGTDVDVAWP
jgi:hypothetical protein